MASSRLKLAATVVSISEGILLRSDLGMLRLEGEDLGAFAKSLVPLLDGSRGADEIARHLPQYEADSVLEFLANLQRQGFLEHVSEGDSCWRVQERFLAAW